MIKALRRTASVAVTFIVVWTALYFWWRSTWHQPSQRELILCGIALPIALTVGIAVARALLQQRKTLPDAQQHGAAATASTSTTTAPPDASQGLTAALIDSSVRVPAGATTAEVLIAAQANRALGLHPDLERPDGSGVFAGSVEALSLDRFDTELLVSAQHETLRDEHWRALALAADALDELLERHAALSNPTPDTPPLKLHLLVPIRWQHEAATLAAWLETHAAQERVPPGLAQAQLHVIANPVQGCMVVDEVIQALHLLPGSEPHVVLAFDSCATQQAVNVLAREGRLYGHDRPDGEVPGEGACALLLARPDTPLAMQAPRLHRLVAAQHVPDGATKSTLDHVLEKARAQFAPLYPGNAPYGLISDADQRNATRSEIVTIAERTWQDEAPARSSHLGLANGASGTALALVTLAVAAQRANDTCQPIFAATLSDPLARAAILVAPGVLATPVPDTA
ncbi:MULTISPECIES: hypothetical protein [unclassified Paraburkholderia]|uniref:hypothetical protein n=1 Tax=unclassified Paraburkholderia TaxID=2615204 RepID=UPI002AB0777F|nr:MULTISPECIES: hypothetical protein [unclassified Paraburkholderia]